MNNVIDMSLYIPKGTTSLVGRQNGKDCKQKIIEAGIIFDELEKKHDQIKVRIPETIMSMNKSFFLAVWADRVMAIGENGFKTKYYFDTSQHIQKKVFRHINAALLVATQEEILDVSPK